MLCWLTWEWILRALCLVKCPTLTLASPCKAATRVTCQQCRLASPCRAATRAACQACRLAARPTCQLCRATARTSWQDLHSNSLRGGTLYGMRWRHSTGVHAQAQACTTLQCLGAGAAGDHEHDNLLVVATWCVSVVCSCVACNGRCCAPDVHQYSSLGCCCKRQSQLLLSYDGDPASRACGKVLFADTQRVYSQHCPIALLASFTITTACLCMLCICMCADTTLAL